MSSTAFVQVPSTHRALTVIDGPNVAVKERPVPKINEDEILIKVVATSINPTDWKHVWMNILKPGQSVGCDFSGDVVQVGKNVTDIHVGEAVAGFVKGSEISDDNGAFQEYVKTDPKTVWVVPKSDVPYEDAAPQGGIALTTSAYALYNGLKLPNPWETVSEPTTVLIWAGSTSVGLYAIALAKLSGLRVVTTASPKNHLLLKRIGADEVFDYKDPDAPRKIKEWSNGQIKHALDSISENGSTKLVAEAMSDDGGRIIIILPVERDESFPPSKIETKHILTYNALHKSDNNYYPWMVEWQKRMPTLAPKLKVMPLNNWPGGLDGLPDALLYLKAGKASAEKVVVRY
ncbi:hypothetical protein FRC05_002347 [Tulasnella sp. 425]|nr:hypothetical protein FRC05_002347 [Tulasnella sp. 425]